MGGGWDGGVGWRLFSLDAGAVLPGNSVRPETGNARFMCPRRIAGERTGDIIPGERKSTKRERERKKQLSA